MNSASSASSSTPSKRPPNTVTKEKVNTTPTDSLDAAVHIVNKWEIYQKTTYPWPLLWSHLCNCGWREVLVTRSNRIEEDSYVFVPSWSIDKCDSKKKRINISSLKANKDYFVSCNDIRVFIQKNGLSGSM